MTTSTADEGYDELDDEPGLSGFWILVIFLAVLAVFAGIVYVAYQKGLHSSASPDSDLPIVHASADPVRREVAIETPDAGRPEVDEELNSTTSTRVIAAIDPGADPMDGFDQGTSSASDRILDDLADRAEETTSRVAAATVTTTPEPAPAVVESTPVAPTVNPRANEPTVSPTPAAAASTAAPTVSNPTHTVQVGAFGSRDEAMEFYGTLMRRHGTLVGNHRPEVQVAVVNGTTYHRLWIGAFGNRGDAASYCQELSGKGQDCLVRAR